MLPVSPAKLMFLLNLSLLKFANLSKTVLIRKTIYFLEFLQKTFEFWPSLPENNNEELIKTNVLKPFDKRPVYCKSQEMYEICQNVSVFFRIRICEELAGIMLITFDFY